MDRSVIQDHLSKAETHISIGEAQIARQRKLVDRLERDGVDATEARRLLTQFEALLELHIADRDRLRAELADQ